MKKKESVQEEEETKELGLEKKASKKENDKKKWMKRI